MLKVAKSTGLVLPAEKTHILLSNRKRAKKGFEEVVCILFVVSFFS